MISELSLDAEEGAKVPLPEIGRHVTRNMFAMGAKGREVALAHLRGYFVAHVKELAEALIVAGLGLDVADGGREVLAASLVNRVWGREAGSVDVDHGGIGAHEFVKAAEGAAVDFPGNGEALA